MGDQKMKKVIGGKGYDTATADLIAEWSNHYFKNDFHYCEEDLYRTKRGSWFIHGQGGAMSKYQEPAGSNSWTGGSDITPLSQDEAFVWLQEHDFVIEVEKYFGDRLESA